MVVVMPNTNLLRLIVALILLLVMCNVLKRVINVFITISLVANEFLARYLLRTLVFLH